MRSFDGLVFVLAIGCGVDSAGPATIDADIVLAGANATVNRASLSAERVVLRPLRVTTRSTTCDYVESAFVSEDVIVARNIGITLQSTSEAQLAAASVPPDEYCGVDLFGLRVAFEGQLVDSRPFALQLTWRMPLPR
jgi:hypothetical protein